MDQRLSSSALCVTHTGKVQRTINLPALYTGVCGLPKFMKFRVLQNFMKVMNLSTLWYSLQKFMIFNLFKANYHEFQVFKVIHEIPVTVWWGRGGCYCMCDISIPSCVVRRLFIPLITGEILAHKTKQA